MHDTENVLLHRAFTCAVSVRIKAKRIVLCSTDRCSLCGLFGFLSAVSVRNSVSNRVCWGIQATSSQLQNLDGLQMQIISHKRE